MLRLHLGPITKAREQLEGCLCLARLLSSSLAASEKAKRQEGEQNVAFGTGSETPRLWLFGTGIEINEVAGVFLHEI